MTYETSKITAWNEAASKAALDNINRVLTGQDQSSQSTRRQRIVRGSVNADGRETVNSSAVHDNSRFPAAPPTPSTVTSSRLNSKDTKSSTSDLHKSGLQHSAAHILKTASTAPSQASIETKHFDSRSFATSPVKPSYANRAKAALSLTDGNSNVLLPYLRKSPSVGSSQSLSNIEVFSQINKVHSNLPTILATGNASSSKDRYEHLVAARLRSSGSEAMQHDNDKKSDKPTSKPMNSGTAAKSAKTDAKFPCSYDDCSMGFDDITALKKHKYLDHDGYCKLCDVDTEDHESLKQHKRDSLKHVCCQWCSRDFRSESGRDYHERQASI